MIGLIAQIVPEPEFIELLNRATVAEVKNLRELGDDKRYFVFDEKGRPQGFCLSPLLGNMLLHQFDVEMNKGDITCLRYLDDFLILGPNGKAVNAAFRRALKLLEEHGLEAYLPEKDPQKTKMGRIEEPFVYLGAEIHGKRIRPSGESQSKLRQQLTHMIQESLTFFQVEGFGQNHSLVQTLYDLSNKLKGWEDHYSFCNDNALWHSLDLDISTLVGDYLKHFVQQRNRLWSSGKKPWQKERRLLGIPLLVECKREPVTF